MGLGQLHEIIKVGAMGLYLDEINKDRAMGLDLDEIYLLRDLPVGRHLNEFYLEVVSFGAKYAIINRRII